MTIRPVSSRSARPGLLLAAALTAAVAVGAGTEQRVYAQDHAILAAPVMKPRPALDGRAARQPMVTDIKRAIVVAPTLQVWQSLPPPEPPQLTDGQISIFDNIGKPLPLSIPGKEGRPTVLVLADTLELETGTYSFQSPASQDLIIMADTVRLKGASTFDLATGRAKAGNLTIIARKYATAEKGYLTFRNQGGDPKAPPGRLLLAVESLELRSQVSRQGQGTFLPPFALEEQVWQRLPHSVRLLVDGKSVNPQIPNGPYVVGYWASYFLSKIAQEIRLTLPATDRATPSALTPKDQELLIRSVKKGRDLIAFLRDLELPPDSEHIKKAFDSKQWIDAAMALLTLWTDELRLASNSSVQVVYDGKAQQAYLSPTNSLVRVVVNDDRRYLGYLDQNSHNPAQVLLSFDIKLGIDSDTEQEVIAMLQKGAGGFSYKGQFKDYEVTASDFGAELPEVKSASVSASGDTVHVSLGLDPESAAITLTRLASGSGVPLRLKWTYRQNATVNGTWQIPVSFARRDLIDVEMLGQDIGNGGKLPVTVEYVVLPDRSIFPLEPALTLQPGAKQPIAIPRASEPGKVLVPPDAVLYHVAADPLGEIFVRDSSIYDTVEITNLLGAHPQLGSLQYVELAVTYAYDPAEGAAPAKKGPFRLASRGTMDSQQKVSFVRRRRGDRDITITGVAVYESGSQQTLRAKKFNSLAAAIERDMLPAE